MKMQQHIITYKKSFINVLLFGTGPKWLICLHGYGENGYSFRVFEKTLGNEYTLVAIDLPFHGETEWNEGLLMTPNDLMNILNMIIQQNKKVKDKPSKFSVLAFSLGGRVALHMLQSTPAEIEKMVLIAPDGLHKNFWYWLGTQTLLGNKLFAYTMKRPYWFFKLTQLAYKIRLLNKSIIRFVHYYLDDEKERSLLYQRWTTMRRFKPNLNAIAGTINNYQIPVRFLFGSYDRIILSKRSNFFKTSKHVKIRIINAGHQLLKEKFAKDIALLFSQ
ncbi:MAG TPA: alpha/beta hydrolase [Chitinophagaceae bacterium]|nr:alpha/beta hydrolase [Chitinophagaceae bacterium]